MNSRKRSTELAATYFIDDVRKLIENGLLVGAVFMDLSRAFDTIGHSVLISKLESYGIGNNEIVLFNDYLFNRNQVFQMNGVQAAFYSLYTRVPKGSILGPLRFILFFNDFEDCLLNELNIAYASTSVHDIENCLNAEFKIISKYLERCELVINLKKGKT